MARGDRPGAIALATMVTLGVGLSPGAAAAQSPWHAQYFPNVELTTHTGARVRFYDLIKGRTVAIELIYTQCRFACPLETARLAQVQALLGERMGRDIFFYSISIDPVHDTPKTLKAFARRYHAGPGWTFLTGRAADIESLSKKLGLYAAPDPDNKDGHMPALLIGNEATGEWIRGSALDNPRMTATMISSWVGLNPGVAATPSYAAAKPLHFTSGEYLFSSKCSPCHSLDHENRIGPGLAGITSARDPGWLARYIADPDGMRLAGDPIAKSLSSRYKPKQMPNLQLTDQQIADVIAFLGSVRPVGSR